MEVAFRKSGERRYGVYVTRDTAPALWLDPAPGYDPDLPHDLLHVVAEAELGLDGGAFGDLAAGGNARIFVPVDKRLVAKMWRAKRIRKVRLPDGHRSEELARTLERAWKTRRCPPGPQPIVEQLDELAERWRALGVGDSLTLEWPRPERTRFDAAARDGRVRRSGQRSRSRHARSPSRQCGNRGASGRSLRNTE